MSARSVTMKELGQQVRYFRIRQQLRTQFLIGVRLPTVVRTDGDEGRLDCVKPLKQFKPPVFTRMLFRHSS
jgi:hypothetical protein